MSKIKVFLLALVIQLFTIGVLFTADRNNGVVYQTNGIALHFDWLEVDLTNHEVVFMTDESQPFRSGAHNVTVFVNGSPFQIPIQVNKDEKQRFTLFTPEQLLVKMEGNIPSGQIERIDLSAIVFEQHNNIPIGQKLTILTSKELCTADCLFSINAPIPNNRVNQYLLTLYTDKKRFQKYLILKEGVAEFLKAFNPLVFDITDGKKISLFESEWVAERQTQSEIIYREQQQVRSVQIITQPDYAQVYFGNELLGITPLELFFTEDAYVELTIRKEGYYEKYLELDMREVKNEFHIELEERNEEQEAEW